MGRTSLGFYNNGVFIQKEFDGSLIVAGASRKQAKIYSAILDQWSSNTHNSEISFKVDYQTTPLNLI